MSDKNTFKRPTESTDLREAQVSSFFEKSHIYLEKPYNIRIRSEITRNFLGNLQDADILDIGCGNGLISSPFAHKGNRVVLMDFSEEMLNHAQNVFGEKKGYEWIRGNFENWNFADRKFDAILCLGVLAHVSSVEATIGKIAKLLKKKGHCILQISDSDHPITRLRLGYAKLKKGSVASYNYELNRTSQLEILSFCEKNGLRLLGKKKYSMLISKAALVPDSLLYCVAKASLDFPMFSRFGSEVIFFLEATRHND